MTMSITTNLKTKPYQITFFLSPELASQGENQEKLNEVVQKIKQEITDKGGSLETPETESSLTNLIKKTLAYPIQKYQEAFYLSLNFLLPPRMIKQFRQQLNLEDNILRYLITARPIAKKIIPETFPGSRKTKTPRAQLTPKKPFLDFGMIDKIEPLSATEPSLTSPEDKTITPSQKKEKPEKVEIEELDKKLEEILNQ